MTVPACGSRRGHTASHRRPHVELCVLALQMQRAAELRCRQSWVRIAHTLAQLKAIRYRSDSQTIVQPPKPSGWASTLKNLGISMPKQILQHRRACPRRRSSIDTHPESSALPQSSDKPTKMSHLEPPRTEIYARDGIDIDRSTLCDWVGQAVFSANSDASRPPIPI